MNKVPSVERPDDQLIARSGNAPTCLGLSHRACLVLHKNLGVWENSDRAVDWAHHGIHHARLWYSTSKHSFGNGGRLAVRNRRLWAQLLIYSFRSIMWQLGCRLRANITTLMCPLIPFQASLYDLNTSCGAPHPILPYTETRYKHAIPMKTIHPS